MDIPFENGNGFRLSARWCEFVAWASLLGAFVGAGRLADLPLCPVHCVTGGECPTCGVTRSVWYVLHGQVARGLDMNPLGLIAVAVLLRRLVTLLLPQSLFVRWANAEVVNLGLLISFFTIGICRWLVLSF